MPLLLRTETLCLPTQKHEEIQAAFSESLRAGEQCLAQLTEEKAEGNWRLMLKDKEIFTKPRLNVLRSLMLNHW
jgi:subtilisin-like proprotein convertase family protein